MSTAPQTAIYGLYCPETGTLRYIGKTIKPRQRLTQHCRGNSAQLHMPVVRWCRDLRLRGLKPRMEVLTWCHDWEAAERRLIAAHRKAGTDLLNVADGGADVPRERAANAPPGCPTAPLYRMAMTEIARIRCMLQDGDSPAVAAWNGMLDDFRGVRKTLLRQGRIESAIAFDLGLWAQFVYGEPVEWDMVQWKPTRKSPARQRPALEALRAAVRRYGIPSAA